MALSVFNPSVLPDLGPGYTPTLLGDLSSIRKPYVQALPRGLVPFQITKLTWSDIEEDDKDYIISFFTSELEGTFGPFLWTPFEKQESPLGVSPRLSQVAGGGLGQTTYYVKFTWYHDTYGETKASAETSLTVDASNFLIVQVPPLPIGITKWRVYVGTASGVVKRESTVEKSRVWTQSGALSGSSDPPNTNSLNQQRQWIWIPDSLAKVRSGDIFWNVKIDLMEVT